MDTVDSAAAELMALLAKDNDQEAQALAARLASTFGVPNKTGPSAGGAAGAGIGVGAGVTTSIGVSPALRGGAPVTQGTPSRAGGAAASSAPPPPPPPPSAVKATPARAAAAPPARQRSPEDDDDRSASRSPSPYSDEGSDNGSRTNSDLYDTGSYTGSEPSGSEATDDIYGDDDGAEFSQDFSLDKEPKSPPKVELPNRPRPYDLWAMAHLPPAPPKPTMKLSPNAFQELVDRLEDSRIQRQVSIMKAQHKQIAAEMSDLTFAPEINATSRQAAAAIPQLHLRLPELEKARKQRLDKIRAETTYKEMQPATFKPDTRNPCVCGVGLPRDEGEESEQSLERHTEYCRRFILACRESDAGESAKKLREKTGRRLHHLEQYESIRKARAEQRRAIFQEEEDRELTFRPATNAASAKMVEALEAKGARPALTVQVDKHAGKAPHQLPGHENDRFVPAINERSRAISKKLDGDAFSRLANKMTVAAASRTMASKASYTPNTSMASETAPGLPRAPSVRVTSDHVNTVHYDAREHTFIQNFFKQQRRQQAGL